MARRHAGQELDAIVAGELRAALFADPKGEHAEKFFEMPGDTAARIDAQVGFIRSQACTGKFVRLLPDKGLKKHIHRIAAPILIVWGKADGIIAPAYADEFAPHIAHARVAMMERAGHMPHFEQARSVAGPVEEFLWN